MARSVGLGCMRLSTAADRDEERGVAVIHAALDAGIRLLDTAHAYGLDESDLGHNERLVARALASWGGDASAVRVVTKGGMARPKGRWVPDGRAKRITADCEASVGALGVERIDTWLLHVPDPKTALATSVRAMARLRDRGLVARIGLCNVTVHQIREAEAVSPVDVVQVAVSPRDDTALRGGVVAHCAERGIEVLAHSPFGGHRAAKRLAKDDTLRNVAERLGATPYEVALAWCRDLPGSVTPLPGATRPETAESAGRATNLTLEPRDRDELGATLVAGALARQPASERRPPDSSDGEVVLIVGIPAAGKSTRARALVDRGYARLNRDATGGRLSDLARSLDDGLAAGGRRFVLDNTYASRAARNEVVETAWRHGVPARCEWVRTPVERAVVNAVRRMLESHGRLLEPDEIKRISRKDPNTFGPNVLFRYERELEPPALEEGYTTVDETEAGADWTAGHDQRAVFFDYHDVLHRSRSGAKRPVSADDVELLPGRAATLARHVGDGQLLVGITWRELGRGEDPEAIRAIFEHTHELLGVPVDLGWCPHTAGPPVCWCRKPLPGLAVERILRHRIDPGGSVLIGRSPADRTLASRLGLRYVEPADFFDNP